MKTIALEYPYDRKLEGETDTAYRYFCVYRDMPTQHEDRTKTRSLINVRPLLGLAETSMNSVYRYADRYHWRERIEAMEQRMVKQALTIRDVGLKEAQQATIQKEGVEIAAMERVLGTAIQDVADRQESALDTDVQDITRLVTALTRLHKIRRLSVSLPTDAKVEKVEEVDPETIYVVGED